MPLTVLDLDCYAAYLRSRNASDSTTEARLRFARRTLERWPDPATIGPYDVAGYLGDPDFSTWTRATYFGHFRSLFSWMVSTGLLEVNPTTELRRPSSPSGRPRPLSVVDARRAQAAATGTTYAMLMLGMLEGLRAHEAAKIHSDDVSAEGLFVRGKGGRDAVLPTHPEILRLAEERSGYWFPGVGGRGHVESDTVSLRITKLFTSLGISGSFHRCRHYYGTSLLRAGVNIRVVQELMRHASLATTAAYLGVGEDEKTAAILALAA